MLIIVLFCLSVCFLTNFNVAWPTKLIWASQSCYLTSAVVLEHVGLILLPYTAFHFVVNRQQFYATDNQRKLGLCLFVYSPLHSSRVGVAVSWLQN